MTSADVVASLNRWGAQSTYGKTLYARVAEVRAVDKLTVEMTLKEKTAIVLISLAVPNNAAAIYPKEIVDKFKPAEKATEWIGTGPFKLVEWKPDRHIKMVRFDDYQPRKEAASGYGGRKVVYVDELLWMPVPDAATRVAQIETGELDFADDLDLNAYERLKSTRGVQAASAQVLGELAQQDDEALWSVGLGPLLWDACRAQARARLDDLAQRIEPAATWDDLVLPELQRQVVTLRDVDGVPAADVCRLLGISGANQRVLLHRGRSRVRGVLAAELGKG